MTRHWSRAWCGVLCGAAVAGTALWGCTTYHPGGSGHSDDTFTYHSTVHQPTTVALVDTRTGQTLWTHEIPVNRQLTVRFYEGQSPDTPDTPARMNWREFEIGTGGGHLDNEMLVPDAGNRRVDVSLRDRPEYSGRAARTDARP